MSDFSLDVKKFSESFIGGAEQAVRGATIKLWSTVIKASPVDSGRFRANWFASNEQPSTKITFNTDKSGSRAISAAANFVDSSRDWSTFTLTNNLPYSEVIEFGLYGNGPKTTGGYSKQAPQGVVRTNIRRFNRLLDQEASKSLPK